MNALFRQEERADQRATDLLLEHLDEDQRASYEANGTFMVEAASGRAYTLGRGERAAICAEANRWWCLEPKGNVPRADWLLAVKLWLEADEAGFLEKANEFVLDHFREPSLHRDVGHFHEWSYLSPLAYNCRCDIEFTGPIRFTTLEQARSYAERRNWHVEINIDRHDVPPIYEAVSWFEREPTYEVDGRPTDEMTVQLLWEAFQQREGARPDAEPTDARREANFLAELPCPFHVGVREGHCS